MQVGIHTTSLVALTRFINIFFQYTFKLLNSFGKVYPELQSKLDKVTLFSFSSTVVLWEIANIIDAYGFYFNSANSASAWVGFVSLLVLVYCVCCWLKSIANRQNSSYIRFSDLTTDEYAAMSYIIPLIIQPVTFYTYCHVTRGSFSWTNRNDTTCVVQLGTLYFLLLMVVGKTTTLEYFNWLYINTDYSTYMMWIVVPGRILHMLAVTNMALLRLKQIFVRYVSHEIR